MTDNETCKYPSIQGKFPESRQHINKQGMCLYQDDFKMTLK